MESAQYFPMRAAIRCKVKQQLLKGTNWLDAPVCVDEFLIKELTTVLLQSRHYQQRYIHCYTREEADRIDDQMAIEVADSYKQVIAKQQDPLIQSLNRLL